MRFRAALWPSATFAKFVASLATLGSNAWVRLDDNEIRFSVIPEQGTQVWAVLSIELIFESYLLQSQASSNTINLEVPLQPLLRALRAVSPSLSASSATGSHSASIRLTKKDDQPSLCVTLVIKTPVRTVLPSGAGDDPVAHDGANLPLYQRERETHISHDVPIRVLSSESVAGLHEPRCRDPDVHIVLPPLAQLKAVSDRFTRLATEGVGGAGAMARGGRKRAKLELSANMHGKLRLGLKTDVMQIQSEWTNLGNPELDPAAIEGGEEGLRQHPSTRMRQRGDEGWAAVRVDARDWGRVLSVGRLGGRVIACFIDEHALILYVYLASEEGAEDSVLTYYVSSHSA